MTRLAAVIVALVIGLALGIGIGYAAWHGGMGMGGMMGDGMGSMMASGKTERSGPAPASGARTIGVTAREFSYSPDHFTMRAGQTVNIDLSDPEWKEAFLMPSEAHGTVVQLAESHGHPETRAELVNRLSLAGLRRIEVTS